MMDEQDQDQTMQSPEDQAEDTDIDLQQQLEEAKAEARKNMDGWKRTAADFENFQRRKEQESKELVQFAREVTVAKLLPTLDSLDQALRHMPSDQDQAQEKLQQWKQGIDGIISQLEKALGELGVKKIEALGKKFDPNFHEAVREVEGEEDGVVVEELQTGFELNGKVIRPATVVISKKK